MRKDLKMRKGKMIAQGCHASMKVFFDIMEETEICENDGEYQGYCFKTTPEMYEWINGIFTKICVSVNSEQELLDVYKQAQELSLPCSLIEDSGLTEFNGVKTLTCCAIGPAKAEVIDKITGNLKLL